MTKWKKQLERFLTRPSDFTWEELVGVLRDFGYQQVRTGKTGGSRARFVQANFPPITLHKPHPKPILKRYQLDEIINLLKHEGFL